jgi:O-antigen/teichoic acid export membrane protein
MRAKITHFFRDDFYRHTAIMVVGSKLGDVFNFIYRLVLVRLLTIEGYSVFNTLISFFVIISQFLSPFQPTLTKFIAGYAAREEWGNIRYLIKRSWIAVGLFSLLTFILFWIASEPIAAFLNITDSMYVILLGLLIATTLLLSVPSSFIQGTQLFVPMAYLSAGSALIKLAVGIGLLCLAKKMANPGLAVSGALWGFISSPVAVILIVIIIIRKWLLAHPETEKPTTVASILPICRYLLPAALIVGSFWTLTNIDIILVKHFFSEQQAGDYSIAQMVGLIVLFLPGTVTLVLFPKAASARAQNLGSRTILKKGLIIVSLFCIPTAVACGLWPGPILTLITGKSNPQSNQLVVWFSVAMSFFSLSMLIIYYHLAVHNVKMAIPLVFLALAQTGTIVLFHQSLKTVLFIVVFYSIITFISSLFMLRYEPGPEESA